MWTSVLRFGHIITVGKVCTETWLNTAYNVSMQSVGECTVDWKCNYSKTGVYRDLVKYCVQC